MQMAARADHHARSRRIRTRPEAETFGRRQMSELALAPAGGSRPSASLLARLRRLAADRDGRAGGSVLAARLAGAGFAYGAQVLAARYLGQEGFGVYALALVWLTLLGHLSVGGTNQALCRYVAEDLATGASDFARGFVRFGVAFALAAGTILGSAAIAIVLLCRGWVDEAVVLPFALAFVAVPLLAVQDNLEALARALNRPLLGIGPVYLVRHGAAALIFAALMLAGAEPSLPVAIAATVAALLVGILVQVRLLRPALAAAIGPGERRFRVRAWLRTAVPIALVDATELLLLNADVLVVGLFLPPEAVATYFAATRIAQILEYVRYSATAATAPRFAALAATGRRVELHRLVALVTAGSGVLTLTGALVLSLAAPALLALFGPDFGPAAILVPILAAGMVATCLLGPGEDVLTMLGQERACATAFGLSLALHLALLFCLVPAFGLVGAAAAAAITMTCRSALLAYLAHARLGMVIPLGLSWRQPHAA